MRSAQSMLLRLLPAVIAGIVLGGMEICLVLATRSELFLSVRQVLRFAAVTTCVAISLQLLFASWTAAVGQILLRITRERFTFAAALTTGLCAAPAAAWLYWTLSAGRRVHALSYRPTAVTLAALLTGLVLMGCMAALLRALDASTRVRGVLCGLLLLTAAVALGVDVWVLHRLYPAFHWALSAISVIAVAAALRLWPYSAQPHSHPAQLAAALGVLAAMLAPFLLRATHHTPNLRYAIAEAAPITGKLLRLVRPPARTPATLALKAAVDAVPIGGGAPSDPSLSLRGDDILVITIDALRADRLRAYGSHLDRAPQLDKLAAGSVVFAHAYTQTPHTSYAIGSLWTGKYLRPVLSLPAASREHATLPRILRRFNYRTAAFYPPAVFFVDEKRFAGLSEDHFGFEYVKEMYAPAHDRVAQLREYLDQVEAGHHVLAWVHLFEPHEPYDPLPQYKRGDEPEQRYDAEVAAADAAVGELIELFRARRPHATVIVTADHGEEFGDHGGHYHGTTLFEEQVKVPLLWSSPGRVAPHRVEAPVQLVDIAPTLLAALGIPRDPRMRGSDLSAALSGTSTLPKARAFASIDELRMWSDGQHKLVCETHEGNCRLYDLSADPSESRDATAAEPQIAERLASELSQLVASIPEGEVLAMQSGDAWPKALAQARLGDRTARDQLLPLLSDARPFVRAETLRALASLRVTIALPVVTTIAQQDTVPFVRDEAALAGLTLGDHNFAKQVLPLLARAHTGDANDLDLARRAAFALTPDAAPEASKTLLDLAADGNASLREREQALTALGQSRARGAAQRIATLLDDVRLRAAVAHCLGQLGGKAAEQALLKALATERYPEARSAEVAALVAMRAKRVLPRIVQLLGTETGLPNGLEQWAALHGPGRLGNATLLDLRVGATPAQLHGTWVCRRALGGEASLPAGCRPGAPRADLTLPLRLPDPQVRVAFTVWASGSDEWLRVGNREIDLHRGRNELALPLRIERGRLQLPLRASSEAFIGLIGIVPRSPDVAPPAPEPFVAQQAPAR
ncbi:MAG: hypothetical protein RL701_7437 [Pseudomonadota bacterium]|jgi:arylsulfatase A-like enzyme